MESKNIQVSYSSNEPLELPNVCFLGEPVEVAVQSEPATISPPGLGLSLKIPRDALQHVKDGNQQLNVSLKTCLSGPAFKYPAGCTPLSAVYHISTDCSLNKNVELTFEHFAELETEMQVDMMAIFRAESSPNRRGEYVFTAVQGGKFAVGNGRCTISTHNTGFWVAGSLPKLNVNIPVEAAAVMAGVEAVTGGTGVGAAVGTGLEGVAGMVYRGVSGVGDILSEYIWSDPTKILPKQTDIKRRYTVLCSYSNDMKYIRRAAIAISLDNAIYTTNFRQALQKEWKTSLSHRSKLNISFEEASVCVKFPLSLKGWDIMSDSVRSVLSQEEVDYPRPASLSLFDYPPRVLFEISKGAEQRC